MMSQNIRAVDGPSPRHGSSWKVARVGVGQHVGLGDPGEALDRGPVEADALVKAFSSSAGATDTDLR